MMNLGRAQGVFVFRKQTEQRWVCFGSVYIAVRHRRRFCEDVSLHSERLSKYNGDIPFEVQLVPVMLAVLTCHRVDEVLRARIFIRWLYEVRHSVLNQSLTAVFP